MKQLLILCFIAVALGSKAIALNSGRSADYQITGVTRDYSQEIYIKGFVINTGQTPLEWVNINAAGYNSRHDMIDQGIDIPVSEISLQPGEKAFFEIRLRDRDGNEIVQYAIKLEFH
jgi:hypothetical protein